MSSFTLLRHITSITKFIQILYKKEMNGCRAAAKKQNQQLRPNASFRHRKQKLPHSKAVGPLLYTIDEGSEHFFY